MGLGHVPGTVDSGDRLLPRPRQGAGGGVRPSARGEAVLSLPTAGTERSRRGWIRLPSPRVLVTPDRGQVCGRRCCGDLEPRCPRSPALGRLRSCLVGTAAEGRPLGVPMAEQYCPSARGHHQVGRQRGGVRPSAQLPGDGCRGSGRRDRPFAVAKFVCKNLRPGFLSPDHSL